MHETKLQLQLQQCQEVFSVFSLSSPTVTFLCSQVEVEVEVEVRGPALDCVSGATCSSSVHYLQILKDQVGLFLGNVILLSCE